MVFINMGKMIAATMPDYAPYVSFFSGSRSLLSRNLGLAILGLWLCGSFLCLLLSNFTGFNIVLVIWVFISTFVGTGVGSAKEWIVLLEWTSSASGAIALVSEAVYESHVWCFSLHATVTRHSLQTRAVVSLGGTSGRHDGFWMLLESGRFGVLLCFWCVWKWWVSLMRILIDGG